MRRPFIFTTIVGFVVAALAVMLSCGDPLINEEVEKLGPEQGTPGPEHRPGQPCVLCHSATGPASSSPFSVAGTIYDTATAATGAANVTVLLRGNDNSSPGSPPITNAAGNFYVRTTTWDPPFPIAVDAVGRPGGPIQKMATTIGREASCAGCHFDAPPDSRYADARARTYEPSQAVGRVTLQ